MSTWSEQLAAVEKMRVQRRQADERLYAIQIELLRVDGQMKKMRSSGSGRSIEEAERKRSALEAEKKRAKAALDAAITHLHEAITGIYADPHPQSVLNKLDDSIPFLLLPVRLETRFKTSGNVRELWVRIYPDDIAIYTHEKTLTDEEIVEGKKYWTFILEAEKAADEDREDLKKDAWSNLAEKFGSSRAAWIALQTKPVNWSELPQLENAGQLIFPEHAQSKPFEWSRAPRTNVLPDKFVLLFYQGETIVKEFPGNIIPDELYLGPDPLESDASFKEAEDDQMLVFGSEYDWTANFDRAVEKGMGFKVPLNADEAAGGFDKILAIGIYASADENAGKQAIENLIDNHHYSPKGFAITKQGTPTNNTEQAASGFSTKDPFDALSFFVESGEPLFEDDEACDGKNLADALGIEYEPLKFVQNSDAKEHREAQAMNTALYPSTLGFYFSTMMKPVLDDASQDRLRHFFNSHVSGAGPVPAIRVGNQPYGILLTSDFGNWRWQPREADFGTPFLTTLYRVLDHYYTIYKSLQEQLMFTGKPGTDPSEVLMNILGLQPGSASFFQRNAFSTEYLMNRDEFQYGGRYYNDLVNSFSTKASLLNFLRNFGFEPPLVNGKADIPQLLRLVYQHYHTRLSAENIVENFPLSETDSLHPYTADKNYIHWLIETTTVTELERQNFGADIKPPTALLYMQLRRALLLAMADASVKWFGRHQVAVEHVMEARSFHNIRPQRDLTKWEIMKGKLAIAQPNHPQAEMAIAEHLLTTGSNESEAAYLKKIKGSLEFLAGRPTAALERRFCEHIDTCTYRLDAWQTALFDQRLKKQRRLKAGGDQPERRKGIYLGAFGWLEDIRPGTKQQIAADTLPEQLRPPENKPVFEYSDNGGFVHAPSINQATAAAVLRSGYLSHATTANPDVMAVNLSSERVRRALFILEGMRNGQTLEALLGFQFERGLHDRGSADDNLKRLNEYIYNFRDVFTIKQHVIPQQGMPAGTTETIERNNVVNGLTLAETTAAFPYGVTLGAVTTEEANAIIAEKDRLNDTLDALKDLFLSESVFQMVQGNFDRAAAVTTALKDAVIPPEIEVIDTPATNHLSFTNRATIQFDASLSFAGESVRARMEPGINEWLRKFTGDPVDLICLLSHTSGTAEEQLEITVADCKLEPIDLLYIVGNDFGTGKSNAAASELESRLVFAYREKQGIDDDITVSIQFTGNTTVGNKKFLGNILPLVKKLKQIITESRPLHAQDFQPPSGPGDIDKTNPHGYQLSELQPRIENVLQEFDDLLKDLNNILSTVTGNTISDANAINLQQLLTKISGFGLADSFPQVKNITSEDRKQVLIGQSENVSGVMSAMLTQANELMSKLTLPETDTIQKKTDLLIAAGKLLFGSSFNILPHFVYSNAIDIQKSNADRDTLLSHVKNSGGMKFPADEWMQKLAPVRPALARWEEVRTMHELIHDSELDLLPVQVPYRVKDSWLAVDFPEKNDDDTPFTIVDDTLSIVIHGETAFSTSATQCGILVDEWTEVVPGKEALTGITFNYNQPDAMAPQALLLAVTPEETGNWSWEKLVGILNDTLLRAKLRAVEPLLLDQLQQPETGVLLPAIISTFSQYDLDISLDYRLNVAFYENNLPLSTIG